VQWLSQREHSRQELRVKLLRAQRQLLALASSSAATNHAPVSYVGQGVRDARVAEGDADHDPAAEVESVLQWLEDQGYLSQARFIESRVHARQARFGNQRIRQELQQHGVSLDAAAAQALQESELARAQALWLKRYGTPAQEASERLRQMRFLAGRGFSHDVVRRVVKGSSDPEAD
jgi:regulatory protein